MINRKGRKVLAKNTKEDPFKLNSLRPLRVLIFLCCFLTTVFSPAQDLKYARKVIDTLCSPSMHGRGYVNDGDKIAADYIQNEFKKFYLQPFNYNFYQEFHLSVNTFPEIVSVTLNGKKLVTGKDFIVSANSYKVKGAYKIFNTDDFINGKGSSKKFYLEKNPARERPAYTGLILLKKKLTGDIAMDTAQYCTIELLDTLLPKKIKKIKIDVENKFIKDYQTQNIISYIKGSQMPDSFLVFTAHYDHLGQMGKAVYFPGANDNASGCAMLLNLAKYYAGHPPKYSIAFIAFGAEEAGLVGSKYYTEHPLFPLKQIKFLMNLDLVGTGDEGITVVNGAILKKEFDILVKLNYEKKNLKLVKPRGKAMNSDHYYFTEKGVKSFFIYTMGGVKAYHDIYDRPETLPLTKFEDLFRLLVDFTNTMNN